MIDFLAVRVCIWMLSVDACMYVMLHIGLDIDQGYILYINNYMIVRPKVHTCILYLPKQIKYFFCSFTVIIYEIGLDPCWSPVRSS